MRVVKRMRRVTADLHADCVYWMRHRTLRPDTRRFLLLHFGHFRLTIYKAVRLIFPSQIMQLFTTRIIRRSYLFDVEFYLRTNLDVAAAGYEAVDHFFKYGDREGRNPMPLFDPRFYRGRAGKSSHGVNSLIHYIWVGRYNGISPSLWFDSQYYLLHNRDVARRGFDPLWHYLRWGGLEGRPPNPSFDGSYYLRMYPDVQAARINPLLHYVEHGRLEGRATRSLEVGQEDQECLHNSPAPAEEIWLPGDWQKLHKRISIKGQNPLVAVIIPVYRNRSLTWRCLASVLTASCITPFRLIVIDDKSPEEELSADLAEMADRGWVDLYVNQKNLGFVASVNRGMNEAGELDVVLLNADTEVYPGWLDRLRNAAHRHPRTASVTPFSNNATIASYPRFLHDAPYPLEISYQELDRLTSEANANVEVEAPTGVGFCMYMRRDAINDIGLFDEHSFGKGYGEENDWCQRAISKGWRNTIGADVFVRHFGSASFQGEKVKRVEAAMRIIEKKHPTYHYQVQAFIANDPLLESRQRLDFHRLKLQSKKENVLIVCHNRGGGTERHVQEDTKELLAQGKGVFYLRPVRDNPNEVRIANVFCRQLRNMPSYPINETANLAKVLRELGISYIHNHGLIDMIAEAPKFLLALSKHMGIPLDEEIHDYKVICPTINLVNEKGYYCGEPDLTSCQRCMNTRSRDYGLIDIQKWRDIHHEVLREARNVLVPDEDVAKRLSRYFPDIKTQVSPHERIYLAIVNNTSVKDKSEVHIVVIGAISRIKGFDILLKCAKESSLKNFPLKFTLLGYSMNDQALEEAGVHVTGRYQESEAETRLHDLEPDAIWLPAIWPETFSYTLSIALLAGYPTFVYDIGAPAKRLRHLGLDKWILPYELAFSAADTLKMLLENSRLRAL